MENSSRVLSSPEPVWVQMGLGTPSWAGRVTLVKFHCSFVVAPERAGKSSGLPSEDSAQPWALAHLALQVVLRPYKGPRRNWKVPCPPHFSGSLASPWGCFPGKLCQNSGWANLRKHQCPLSGGAASIREGCFCQADTSCHSVQSTKHPRTNCPHPTSLHPWGGSTGRDWPLCSLRDE